MHVQVRALGEILQKRIELRRSRLLGGFKSMGSAGLR